MVPLDQKWCLRPEMGPKTGVFGPEMVQKLVYLVQKWVQNGVFGPEMGPKMVYF